MKKQVNNLFFLFVVLVTLSPSFSLLAEEISVEESTRIFVGERVLVRGQRRGPMPPELPASVDVISQDQLEREHVDNTMELFSKVPGVYFSHFNQGLINTDIAIRGFNSEGSLPHIKLLIDGIPSNLHNGYSEMDALFPLEIQQIELVKATSDPRYGIHNLAGNINILTRREQLQNRFGLLVGSWDTQEAQANVGQKIGNFSHDYFLGARRTDGYRDHAELEKQALAGKWFYGSERLSLGLIARYLDFDADAPGYLTRDEARRRPRSSAPYAQRDGGDKITRHLSGHLDYTWNDSAAWSVKIYNQDFDRNRWVRFSAESDLQHRIESENHRGIISTLHWEPTVYWHLAWGLDHETQDVSEKRLTYSDESLPAAVNRDRSYIFRTAGTYIQLQQKFSPIFTWNVALRGDRLSGSFHELSADGSRSDRDMYEFGTLMQPKAGILLRPVSQLTIFSNYGRSFQHPIGKDTYKAPDSPVRSMSLNDGWELGTKWEASESSSIRLSAWEQKASREYVSNITGELENIGETLRQGIDFGFHWYPSSAVSLWGSYTVQKATLKQPGGSDPGIKGNHLRGVPDFTASLGSDYRFLDHFLIGAHLDSQGGYYLNEANVLSNGSRERFGAYTLLNISFKHEAEWGHTGFLVSNAFDEYYEYVYDLGPETIHSPGDGRGYSASVTLVL